MQRWVKTHGPVAMLNNCILPQTSAKASTRSSSSTSELLWWLSHLNEEMVVKGEVEKIWQDYAVELLALEIW